MSLKITVDIKHDHESEEHDVEIQVLARGEDACQHEIREAEKLMCLLEAIRSEDNVVMIIEKKELEKILAKDNPEIVDLTNLLKKSMEKKPAVSLDDTTIPNGQKAN